MQVGKHYDPLLDVAHRTKKKEQTILDEFFGVYCLVSQSEHPSYKNRCYVGYTVDPNRRVCQHNGDIQGGAKKTSGRGPWKMVCVVHGFPNSISALRFEWAWQNPQQSKRLRPLILKKIPRKESPFEFHLRVVSHMLTVDPWRRLTLTFRWLVQDYERAFPIEIPAHVQISHGLVEKTHTVVPLEIRDYLMIGTCAVCLNPIDRIADLVECLRDSCRAAYHCHCLAEHQLQKEKTLKTALFPLSATCLTCSETHLWGDLIRRQRCFLAVDAEKPFYDGQRMAAGMIPRFIRKVTPKEAKDNRQQTDNTQSPEVNQPTQLI